MEIEFGLSSIEVAGPPNYGLRIANACTDFYTTSVLDVKWKWILNFSICMVVGRGGLSISPAIDSVRYLFLFIPPIVY